MAAIDATGYDARPVSGYFVRRCGRRGTQRRWPKLAAVIGTRTHLLLSASVTRGPRQDAPQLVPAVRRAVKNAPIGTLLADAGYDSEDDHATCRERLGSRSTVIALNWRGSRKWPKARCRRQMVKRFRKKPHAVRARRVYARRVQAESAFSRNKRRLGATVAAVVWAYQKTEILLKAFAHNVMLLAARNSTWPPTGRGSKAGRPPPQRSQSLGPLAAHRHPVRPRPARFIPPPPGFLGPPVFPRYNFRA